METGTTRIVYTSTYNVVFGGQEIRDGNSSLPYFPIDQHVDHYSKTKSVAEQEVRKASGMEVMNKGKRVTLRTCALRCAGIYGEGEMKHLPRIVVSKWIQNSRSLINTLPLLFLPSSFPPPPPPPPPLPPSLLLLLFPSLHTLIVLYRKRLV